MPNTRKKIIKTVYKDDDSDEEAGDFSDSGSEALISDASDSDDENFQSDHSSEGDYDNNRKKNKSLMAKKAIVKPKLTKFLLSKLGKQNESSDNELLYRLEDLTEEDKLLPSILNLSESDSSDDESPRLVKNIPSTSCFDKERIHESDTEMATEYKDVWSSNKVDNSEEIARKTFLELEQHHSKIEATKATINKYSSAMEHKESDVQDLLALGEEGSKRKPVKKKVKSKDDSDSDVEDWEEVNETKNVPQQGLELFVEFPNTVCRKRKKIDVEMMMKRKLNRVKKEQQVYLHKVHVLCWIGHGNYVNRVLNDQDVMTAALSLLPSKECYPGERVDIKYFEQITSWFKDKLTLKLDRHEDKFKPKAPPLKELLLDQIKQKLVKSRKYLVYIFIAILRALGLQCRIMFNFVTLPLKPDSSNLCSLSTKTQHETVNKTKTTSDEKIDRKTKNKKTVLKEKTKPCMEKLSQLDGNVDCEFDSITQFDGSNDESSSKNRRSKRAKNTKPQKTDIKDEDVSSTKIKDKSKEKSSLNPISKTQLSSKASRKKNCVGKNDKSKKDDRDENDSKVSKKLSSQRKTVVTTTNLANDSINMRKTRSSKTATNTIPKEHSICSQIIKSVHTPTQKVNKLVAPELILTHATVSSEYFGDVQNSEDKQLRLARKRSHTSESSYGDNTKKKITKTRTKSAPEKVVRNSKYFSVASNSVDNPETCLESPKNKKSEEKLIHKELGKTRSKSKINVTNDLIDIIKTRIKEEDSNSPNCVMKGKGSRKPQDKNYLKEEESTQCESDDDFKPTKLNFKPSVSRKIDRRVLSSDDEKSKFKIDIWCEVFVEELEQWICVDIIKQKIHDSTAVYNLATHPVCYVVGWDNNNYLKDLTRRYVPHWNTVTRKQRADPEWFNKAIRPWLGPKTARDKDENEYLDRMQLEAPLPKNISEYKNHPLYALKRHLLKFEALYPPDAATLGFIRGEAVYSRDCVYVCRSREIWLKEAKVVCLGEEPYKIVKSRPKWDKLSNKLITDKPLEIFGPWQVKDFEPPVAENGIVPRNAYGNVELFKECMIPKGTVLIKLPGLSKVAKKLNVDCAPAVTGFDYSGGWAHPVYGGFVVCQEFEEIITEAWLEDQEEQERRQLEKMENRVYGNWRKLIKGLLIRERINTKYGFEDPKKSEELKSKSKGPCLVVKKKR